MVRLARIPAVCFSIFIAVVALVVFPAAVRVENPFEIQFREDFRVPFRTGRILAPFISTIDR